jgi:hypothetical protein
LVRGILKEIEHWDRIYITTLFSFCHDKIIKTILHYKQVLGNDLRRIFVGGVYATLYPETIFNETGVWPVAGQLNTPNTLGFGDKDACIDTLIPDYDLLKDIDYDYGLKDCYFGYATRGCKRQCPFCAVWKLEPVFNPYTGLKKYIEEIIKRYGERQNMVLMDNNVLASEQFDQIVGDLIDLHFEKGAKFNKKLRFVDFNQGLDARLVTRDKAKKLASICLKPVRLAYDKSSERERFERAVRYLADEGITDFSTYILFNYEESPSDFYERIAHCNELNQLFGIKIYSFPMRYTPLDQRNRTYVGPQWHFKLIGGLQRELNVTKGTVSPGNSFFLRAFGETPEDFEEICAMPDHFILYRDMYENNEAAAWRRIYRKLSQELKQQYLEITSRNTYNTPEMKDAYEKTTSKQVKELLEPFLRPIPRHETKTIKNP